jgi:hypothetical protein
MYLKKLGEGMKKTITERGFALIEFKDHYDTKCNIQESSLACTDAIWIGVEDANPRIMASQAEENGVETDETCGWVRYPIPEDVFLTTRMHLTKEQVKEILPILERFVETGGII